MEYDYESQKDLVEAILDQFSIGTGKTQAAIVLFGSQVKTVLSFKDSQSVSALKNALQNAPFVGGQSRLDLGLRRAQHIFKGILITITC